MADELATPEPEELAARLGHVFADPALLRRALTHASATSDKTEDNERLEFLGDGVLDLIIREKLFRGCPEKSEGELTEIKSLVVRKASLAKAARGLGLRDFLTLGRGIGNGHSLPASVYANALEAVIAALYLDGGYAAAERFVLELMDQPLRAAIADAGATNHKSALQQFAQRDGPQSVEYAVIAEEGPDHSKQFTVAALVGGAELGRGQGLNKKDAEQNAARAALEHLTAEESGQN